VRTLLAPAPLETGELTLDGDEAHHGLRVLRLGAGDAVRLADGAGRVAEAQVVEAGRSLRLLVGTVEVLPAERCASLAVAVAPPKGDRWTDLVRGLSELGVASILPLRCARGEREPANLDRARRIAGEALKQSRRGWLPRLGPAIDIAGLAAGGTRLIVGDPAGGPPRPGRPCPTTLVIGPEGGLTADELTALDAAGAERVRLAGPVLRIETAALAAAAVWASAWEHEAP
jgi:16S rRNA (uracil1498-N3)-methyltransferase